MSAGLWSFLSMCFRCEDISQRVGFSPNAPMDSARAPGLFPGKTELNDISICGGAIYPFSINREHAVDKNPSARVLFEGFLRRAILVGYNR